MYAVFKTAPVLNLNHLVGAGVTLRLLFRVPAYSHTALSRQRFEPQYGQQGRPRKGEDVQSRPFGPTMDPNAEPR